MPSLQMALRNLQQTQVMCKTSIVLSKMMNMRHNVIKLQLISLFGKALCSLRCLIHFLYLAQYIVLVIGFRTLQTMCLFILSNHFIWSLHTNKFFIKEFSKYKLFLRLNVELKTTVITRGGSRTAATSKMERFVIIVNCYVYVWCQKKYLHCTIS